MLTLADSWVKATFIQQLTVTNGMGTIRRRTNQRKINAVIFIVGTVNAIVNHSQALFLVEQTAPLLADAFLTVHKQPVCTEHILAPVFAVPDCRRNFQFHHPVLFMPENPLFQFPFRTLLREPIGLNQGGIFPGKLCFHHGPDRTIFHNPYTGFYSIAAVGITLHHFRRCKNEPTLLIIKPIGGHQPGIRRIPEHHRRKSTCLHIILAANTVLFHQAGFPADLKAHIPIVKDNGFQTVIAKLLIHLRNLFQHTVKSGNA